MVVESTARIQVVSQFVPAVMDGLCETLIDCVEGCASVGFMLPMTMEKTRFFWDGVAASASRGERLVLWAEDSLGCAGTVQIVLAQPENQPHRADLVKMLVPRRCRRAGTGAALLRAAEEAALAHGKTLLVLDTANADAERLYARGGWHACGVIPHFALMPDGTPCSTRLFYKQLAPK